MSDPHDPAGAIVAKYEYDPYGNVTAKSGSYADENPFRFSTKYFDVETGLSYFGGRYYNAALGRWLNRDPLDELGGVNLYAYAGNDPIDRIDPLGQMWCSREQGCYLAGGQNEGKTNCPRKGQSRPTRKPQTQPTTQSQPTTKPDDPCEQCEQNVRKARATLSVQIAEATYMSMECGPNRTAPPPLNIHCVPDGSQPLPGRYGNAGQITIQCGSGAAPGGGDGPPAGLVGLILHEIVHAKLECRGEYDYHPESTDPLDVSECVRQEAKAYMAECRATTHGRKTVIDCCVAGIGASCPNAPPGAGRGTCEWEYMVATGGR